jgi:biopolymer transport protein ExbD
MAQIDTGGRKGSVHLDINLVPFVDVMSCLTAFLLVTAVWIRTANLKNEPVGRGADNPVENRARIAILIASDGIDVEAIPADDAVPVARRAIHADDWAQLEATLHDLQASGERAHVEIAALSTREHPIPYQTLIAAMDTTVKVGFTHVGVVDPAQLAR